MIQIEGNKFMLAGACYGNTWHATAIVTNSDGKLLKCNDNFVVETGVARMREVIMIFYTRGKSGRGQM